MYTQKEKYILEKGQELDVQSFYVIFGFKTRGFAESEFRKAMLSVYNGLVDGELKTLFYNEYIENDFPILNDNYVLDDYWINIMRDTLATQTTKRKMDVALTSSFLPNKQLRTTNKDKQMSSLIARNEIYDFSNEGPSSQLASSENWEEMKKDHLKVYDIPSLDDQIKDAVGSIFIKKMTLFRKYQKSLGYHQQVPEDQVFIYKIITHIIEAFDLNPEIFDLTLPPPSEGNLNNRIWARIIEALFSKSSIKILSGDTILKDLSCEFKVDYRLGCYINNTFVDLANIEVGRWPRDNKIKSDHVKLLLESKAIINRIVAKYGFINPSSFDIFSLQVCGLKGDLLSTTLASPKRYYTSRTCDRLRVPLTCDDSETMVNFLSRLIFFKEQVEELGLHIKNEINKALDRRSSFGKSLGPNFKLMQVDYTKWIEKVTIEL